MSRLHFDVPDPVARSLTLKNLGRKWRDFKDKIWHKFNDSSFTLEEMYEKVLDGFPRDQWTAFIDKNNEEKYNVMSNAKELGHLVGRIDLGFYVHKKSDGTYVNEVAKNKGVSLYFMFYDIRLHIHKRINEVDILLLHEQIKEILSQDPSLQSQAMS